MYQQIKKLGVTHHCRTQGKSRVFYNSSFKDTVLFDKKVIQTLHSLPCVKQKSYSDVAKVSPVCKPLQVNRHSVNHVYENKCKPARNIHSQVKGTVFVNKENVKSVPVHIRVVNKNHPSIETKQVSFCSTNRFQILDSLVEGNEDHHPSVDTTIISKSASIRGKKTNKNKKYVKAPTITTPDCKYDLGLSSIANKGEKIARVREAAFNTVVF